MQLSCYNRAWKEREWYLSLEIMNAVYIASDNHCMDSVA